MDYNEYIELVKKILHNPTGNKRYIHIIESLPDFWRWVAPNKAKLKKNLIKASFLTLIENGSNYDMFFTQDIGRRYKPSTKQWIERRQDHEIATLKDVPLEDIHKKYFWIMGL